MFCFVKNCGFFKGKGKLIDCFGNVIEGTFLKHKADGYCEISYKNGDKFSGNMTGGCREGKGKFIDNVNKSEYEGEWKMDKREGSGVFVKEEGYRYEGQWVDNIPEGFFFLLLLLLENFYLI